MWLNKIRRLVCHWFGHNWALPLYPSMYENRVVCSRCGAIE